MAATVSFDITSSVDLQEVDNAVNQATKGNRPALRLQGVEGVDRIQGAENRIELVADDNFKMEAVWDILLTRMVRRGVPTKNLKPSEITAIGGSLVKRTVELQQGIPVEAAKSIVKFLKDQKLKKVQATIQSDQVRVSSSSKDELQAAIHMLKGQDFGIELQFGNYRE